MKMKHLTPLFVLLLCQALSAQVKIGDNPQNIDPASLLELESTEQVLVITRVTTAQMEVIAPTNGAMVYNTDEGCLYYYNEQRWLNLCEALGLNITAEAIENEFPTVLITEDGNSVNIEVGQIRGGDDTATINNIVDRSIRGEDIGINVVDEQNLAPNSVGTAEIRDNAVSENKILPGIPGQVLTTSGGGPVVWSYPAVVAWAKWNGALTKFFGIQNIVNPDPGEYRVILSDPRNSADYTIQITPLGNYRIFVSSQTANDFTVSVRDIAGDPVNAITGFYVTVIDN